MDFGQVLGADIPSEIVRLCSVFWIDVSKDFGIPRGSIWIITSKNSSRLNYFPVPKNFEFFKNSKF